MFPVNCIHSIDLVWLFGYQFLRYVEHLFHCEIFCIFDGMATVWVILPHEYRCLECSRHKHSAYHRMCKSGKQHKMGTSALCTMDENCFLCDPTLAQDVCVWDECHCQVYCNKLWCDHCATTLQGFNKPRFLASRGCVRFVRRPSLHWEEKIHNSTHAHMGRSFDSSNPSYSYPETSIVIRRHYTICQVNSSRSALYPFQALI